MESLKTNIVELKFGNTVLLAQRETFPDPYYGHITLFEPGTMAVVARISMAADRSMTIETMLGPVPRAAVEWLISRADSALA